MSRSDKGNLSKSRPFDTTINGEELRHRSTNSRKRGINRERVNESRSTRRLGLGELLQKKASELRMGVGQDAAFAHKKQHEEAVNGDDFDDSTNSRIEAFLLPFSMNHTSSSSINNGDSVPLLSEDDEEEDIEIETIVDDKAGETFWSVTIQIFIPFLIAGLGMVGAGLILDVVQHWTVFVQVPEVFILVPALLGLKGNLEMTLASRLSVKENQILKLILHPSCYFYLILIDASQSWKSRYASSQMEFGHWKSKPRSGMTMKP